MYVINIMVFRSPSRFETIDIALSILIISSVTAFFLLYMVYTLYVYSRMERQIMNTQKEMLARENEIIVQCCRQDAKRLHDLKHTWIYL